MQRFNNGFVSSDEKTAEMADLVMGVYICSQTYEEFWQSIDEEDFLTRIQKWGEFAKDFDLKEKSLLFLKYIHDGSEQPVVIYEGETSQSGAHWAQTVLTVLTGQCGYTRSEALNAPLSLALHDFYKLAESNGLVTLATPDIAAALNEQEDGCPAQ